MTKYIVAILLFVAALAGFLLYIGDDATLTLTSSAQSGLLEMAPITVTWQAAIVLGTLGVMALLALWTFLGWLWSLPSRLKSGAGLRRRNQALEAMEAALLAGAEGNPTKARRKAEKARALVHSPTLGRIISAQAAEAGGDDEEAISHYTAMLDDEKTHATGQRGLAKLLLARGDLSGAIEHAGNAYDENKKARWAFDVLFKAQTSDYRWDDAHETLMTGESRGHIDKEVAARRDAVVQTASASDLYAADRKDEAATKVVAAALKAPAFAPAVALAAQLLKEDDQTKKAAGLIEKAWTAAPHPALAIAFRDLFAGESDRVRDKRLESLIKTNPDHRESAILKAEEALSHGRAVEAWSALSPLMQKGEPSARLCLLAARAETALNNAKEAAVWTEKAAVAPAEPDWSDLDPEGDAFDYTNRDWARMVFSFGDKGEMIHPRFETGAGRRSVLPVDVTLVAEEPKAEEVTPEAPLRQPDDPGTEGGSDSGDLAMRLDSLLGKEAKR